jgi:hypothetical protein
MTDTEAKALALVNEIAAERDHPPFEVIARAVTTTEALCRAIEREAATEARHAAELREQAERFSEAALLVDGDLEARGFAKTGPMRSRLAPFILPAPDPDPLVEAFASLPVGFAGCVDGADALRAAMQARGYEWRKIGEAGE